MKTFRFRLDRVLDWRRTELDMEESRLKQLHAAVAVLDRERSDLEAAGEKARRTVATCASAEAFELHAFEAFRGTVKLHCRRLLEKRREREVEIAAQQQKLLEARRRCRLLENLRDRRFTEWKYEGERQEEAELPPRPLPPKPLPPTPVPPRPLTPPPLLPRPLLPSPAATPPQSSPQRCRLESAA